VLVLLMFVVNLRNIYPLNDTVFLTLAWCYLYFSVLCLSFISGACVCLYVIVFINTTLSLPYCAYDSLETLLALQK